MWTCISVCITWHFATFVLEIYTYAMTYQLNFVNNACLMELWAKTGLYTFLWKSCISIRISSLYIISPFDNCYSGSMIWRSWQTHDIFAAFFCFDMARSLFQKVLWGYEVQPTWWSIVTWRLPSIVSWKVVIQWWRSAGWRMDSGSAVLGGIPVLLKKKSRDQ